VSPAAPEAVTSAICSAIGTVFSDTGRAGRLVQPEMLLGRDLGLDSLDLAQTIVLLERSLGIDPFRTSSLGPRPSLRTVADLAAIYSAALESQTHSPPDP